jgi:catechol 2,3-dioxygenase-like lactoylglutathione lyase family enzyme
MSAARLEHANITVSDPKATAQRFCDLFGWHVRWEGDAKDNGYTIHVGGEDTYLAVYATPGQRQEIAHYSTYRTRGALNHLGIVVDDIDAAEDRVKAAGYTTTNHGDYEPGRRFYFDNEDGIEIEVVSYA